jgi:putative alpha-1,2-mannosidase
MSSWYVFNAMGFYPYSPADPKYIVTVPLFNKVVLKLDESKSFTIAKKNSGEKITNLALDGRKIDDYFITQDDLANGKELKIITK